MEILCPYNIWTYRVVSPSIVWVAMTLNLNVSKYFVYKLPVHSIATNLYKEAWDDIIVASTLCAL